MSADEHLSPTQFFHGSAHRIVRGGMVLPRSTTGASTWLDAGSPDHAHATTSMASAAWYGEAAASRRGLTAPSYVYRVEPVGHTEPDPADDTAVRSREGFKVVDWVPKRTWSRAK